MNNYIQSGATIPVTAPYNVAGGDGMLVGALFLVAAHAALSGEQVEGKTVGVYSLKAKVSDAIAQGAVVYWDNVAREITSTADGNTKVGCVSVAKGAGEAACNVRLNGTV
jgi:predicted RecA/RadA family phage recombinase